MTKRHSLDILCSFQKAEADERVKMIILEGQGEKAFCAGGDIRGMSHLLVHNGREGGRGGRGEGRGEGRGRGGEEAESSILKSIVLARVQVRITST